MYVKISTVKKTVCVPGLVIDPETGEEKMGKIDQVVVLGYYPYYFDERGCVEAVKELGFIWQHLEAKTLPQTPEAAQKLYDDWLAQRLKPVSA